MRQSISTPAATHGNQMTAISMPHGNGGTTATSYLAQPEGMHDDCVCALALAVSGRANQPRSTFIAV